MAERAPGVALALALVLASGVATAGARADDGGAGVTFMVTVPPSTPVDAAVWISGNAAALGSWNGAGVRLEPRGEHQFAATVAIPAGTALEFKLTRGAWDTVEKGAAGDEIDNRRWVVRARDTVYVTVATWRDQTSARAAAKRSTRTGDIRVHAAFASRFVKPRDVLVWLPPGYAADTTRRYPVLYFHDGNNVFDDSTSFAGEWHLDEIGARLIGEGRAAPFIAVAVYNTPDRVAEYTPVADPRHGGGHAADYARFLVGELKPFIDRAYRTRHEPAATGIAGSSLGGLASLAIAMDHPDVFGLVGAVSPSAWWADRWIVARAATSPRTLRVWIDIGTAESGLNDDPGQYVSGARGVRDALVGAGFRDASAGEAPPGGGVVRYLEVEGGRHNESAWSARLDRILEFLLPPAAPAAPPRRARR